MSLPHSLIIDPILEQALREDMGRAGDITTNAIAPADLVIRADFRFREAGRVCGLGTARRILALVDPSVTFLTQADDGSDVAANTTIATLTGPARSILTGERVALNLLGRLSAIATLTRTCVERVGPHRARIADTRKTTPGLRILEKWAVRTGGGINHRFGLDDAAMIKDNHVAVAGSPAEAIRRVRQRLGHMVKIEIEVDTLAQLEDILALPASDLADSVLLDNMTPDTMAKAVMMIGGRMIVEASGGITPDTIPAVAATGVDVISLGFLTHSVRQLDVGLDICSP